MENMPRQHLFILKYETERKIRDKLPFDISGFRTIFYDNSIGGKRRVEETLSYFKSDAERGDGFYVRKKTK